MDGSNILGDFRLHLFFFVLFIVFPLIENMVILGSSGCVSGLGSWFSIRGLMDSGSCGEVSYRVA